mmetsp:Transcript_41689/g.111159  ORF Transcript_41689/g.111159 Transcript_41689/m.111159 type:complete len:234 (+) Transcript_41689:1376-2077(+)
MTICPSYAASVAAAPPALSAAPAPAPDDDDVDGGGVLAPSPPDPPVPPETTWLGRRRRFCLEWAEQHAPPHRAHLIVFLSHEPDSCAPHTQHTSTACGLPLPLLPFAAVEPTSSLLPLRLLLPLPPPPPPPEVVSSALDVALEPPAGGRGGDANVTPPTSSGAAVTVTIGVWTGGGVGGGCGTVPQARHESAWYSCVPEPSSASSSVQSFSNVHASQRQVGAGAGAVDGTFGS